MADETKGITKITVSGFKSLGEESSIEVRPLTILAGANSSGKSSIMQPLLLMKQTLEATYDPGPLLLDGPNVRFTEGEQLLFRFGKEQNEKLIFQIGVNGRESLTNSFRYKKMKRKREIELVEMVYHRTAKSGIGFDQK
jgi:AAA15 family ATPase/GTPase